MPSHLTFARWDVFLLAFPPIAQAAAYHSPSTKARSNTSARMVHFSVSALLAVATTLISLANAHRYAPKWNLATFKEPDCNPNATIGPPLPLVEGNCHVWRSSNRWQSIGPIWAMRQYKNKADDPYKGKMTDNEPDPDLRNKYEIGSCQLSTFAQKGCKGPYLDTIRGGMFDSQAEWCMQVDDDVMSMRVDCEKKDDGKW